jgi:hypothetical protein
MQKKVIQGATQIPQACAWLTHWLAKGLAGGKPVMIKLAHESRSEAQNRHLWPMLTCLAQQKEYGGKLRTNEEWKIIMISAYKFDPQGIVIGINGEVVNLNYSTKELNKSQFSEFIELIYAQGSEWAIKWSDPALKIYDEWGIGE